MLNLIQKSFHLAVPRTTNQNVPPLVTSMRGRKVCSTKPEKGVGKSVKEEKTEKSDKRGKDSAGDQCKGKVSRSSPKPEKGSTKSTKVEKPDQSSKGDAAVQCKSNIKTEKDANKSAKDEKTDKGEQCGTASGSSDVPRVAINGFGRIGRMALRVAVEHECPLEIVAINDSMMTPDYMAYLLKYDSTHGPFVGEVEVAGSKLVVDGKAMCTYKEVDPGNIPWKDLRVDYVIESTGMFKTVKTASSHLSSGAKKVVITSHSADAPMYVIGVNHDTYDPSKHVISSASCTTNALAPLVKVVHEKFGLEEGLMTTVHAVTSSQNVLDSSSIKNWRVGRGALQNIIPTSTAASEAIGNILPDLKGKLSATSIRVPIPNVSLIDLTCRLTKEATMEEIACALCEAAEGPLLGILNVTTDEVVSSDFIGSTFSCVFDRKASMALSKKFIKLIAWYDNEYGYACRVIDLIKLMHSEN